MGGLGDLNQSGKSRHDPSTRHAQMEQACAELCDAVEDGSMGKIVAKHEALILHYYQDVQEQARKSFAAAQSAARIGFWVLIIALAYALVFDALGRFKVVTASTTDGSLTVAGIGLVSGTLIEFIAGIAFWLYSRGSKQFGAFHICLERTHRYLLAYSIANQMTDKKNEAFNAISCIMANAPMITRADIDSVGSSAAVSKEGNPPRLTAAIAT